MGFLLIFLATSCSKKEVEINTPPDKEKSFEIYKEAMVAMEKAEVSLRLMMQVRNNLVRAYQEVQNMPV